jgi:hypothetical protein
MTAPNNGASNFGFVGSYAGPVETDVIVSSDIVSFVDGDTQGGVFGVAARLNGLNGVGQLGGYAYLYEPFANGGNGELVLAKIGPGVDVRDLGAQGVENVDYVRKVTLDPNKDYTFSLRVVGNLLSGEVHEVGGPLVAYQSTTDTSPSPPWTSGYSGYVAYSQGPSTGNPAGFPPTDITWDNFGSTTVPEPVAGLLFACGVGIMCLGRRRRAA